ncbi:TIGR01440 family protein [Jeotgalibacillus sp. R-1-5s-1]|uniref:TIGR01440 family protein n=1 Tax=Jeotgalibacillus sp. R-1-5s-1 TaxID=2555897 RepID=UPI00106B4026|nr:TIGR01440 family protein [Jeotgalibacillus sp. R-1-5s-1]TFD96996.1 TIGR01440 family protein [Jeotgalibacillus sp. R-1-5s-1]
MKQELLAILNEYQEQSSLKKGQLFVIGCSTSEVVGKKIGTSGTDEVAADLFDGFKTFSEQTGIHLAFQGCEHINRALIMEREAAEKYGFDEVTVVPVRKAGGAMASYAYRHFKDPVTVERIQAHGGIDIGDTLIGMHLKPVAVPVRVSTKTLGEAHITLARTRPKLIGGARAVYELE